MIADLLTVLIALYVELTDRIIPALWAAPVLRQAPAANREWRENRNASPSDQPVCGRTRASAKPGAVHLMSSPA